LNEGGVERGVVELSRELVSRGHESIVISRGGKLAATIEADGGTHISFDVCSKNPLTVPLRMVQLRELLRRVRPDILHARSRVPAWLTVMANWTLRIPFVTTVHGFNSVSPYSRVMTWGDRVICVSGAIREHILRHYAVDPGKCVVIPRGVDLQLFDPRAVDQGFMTEFSDRFGLAGRFVVSSVGRITQLKDYETFIRAIALLKEEHPHVLGLIVGGVREDKAGYYASLQSLVTSLGLQGEIVFTGSQSKVAEIYALSDLVVSSSKKPESFGRSAAEALAMNVPVVASAHGGVLDIVREGETGCLFPPGDAPALAAAVARCRTVPRSGLREFVAVNFTLQRMVENTLDVYARLSGSSKGSRL
jgi:glycosyltransferase involved in cell wall biosynthesis